MPASARVSFSRRISRRRECTKRRIGIERAGEQVVEGVIAGEDEGVEGCGHACLV